jgi:hypothetical protein
MNNLLFITIMFVSTVNLSAQGVKYPNKGDSTIIKIKEFYNGCGKIFNEDKIGILSALKGKSIFQPTATDLILAEQIMSEKYSDLIKSDERAKSLIGTEYKSNYYNSYRQYIGIINSSGNKIIFIQLLKCCKKNINKCFPDWKVEFPPMDEDICTITIAFTVNLEERTIALY